MVGENILKEIIVGNEKFILEDLNEPIDREFVSFPEKLKKVHVLYGARRTGKTYMLFGVFRRNSDSSLYIDFEDERLKDFESSDFQKLKEVFFELKPELLDSNKVNFLFDEIHNIDGWEKFCRRLVERENINVFVAGSSSKITPSEVHSSLRGRYWSLEVFPFSFREFLTAKGFEQKENLIYGSKKPLIKKNFMEYLEWGGFPEVVLTDKEFEKRKILKEYMDAMYFKDLVERFDIKNITLLETLWEKLFSSFSTKLSLHAFYKQFKDNFPFSKESLYSYFHYFLRSWLAFQVDKFSESEYVRKRNPGKIYLLDNGLSRRVTSTDYGRLLENIVFLELRRKSREIFYFQEKKECDFIVKEENRLRAIQVTWEPNNKNSEREEKGIVEFCRRFKLNRGTILSFNSEDKIKKGNIEIEVTPVWKWLLE